MCYILIFEAFQLQSVFSHCYYDYSFTPEQKLSTAKVPIDSMVPLMQKTTTLEPQVKIFVFHVYELQVSFFRSPVHALLFVTLKLYMIFLDYL